jgi:hypothetical protein
VTDDLLRELSRLQRYAAGLRELLSEAQAESPRQTEATDRSGAVRMVLGPDGLPVSIRVAAGWERKIAPAAFGGAVAEAFSAAARERMAAWTQQLSDSRWQQKAGRLREDISAGRPGTPHDQVPPAFTRDPGDIQPRPIDALAEDVLKALDAAQEAAAAKPAKPPQGTGQSAMGKLVLTLSSGGLVSCTADPRWVSQQTAVKLTDALGQALAAARTQLAEATKAAQAAATQRSDGLSQLLGEALSLLNDPRRLSQS